MALYKQKRERKRNFLYNHGAIMFIMSTSFSHIYVFQTVSFRTQYEASVNLKKVKNKLFFFSIKIHY